MGGLRGYIEWAMAHKTDFYSRLCPKLFGGEIALILKDNPDEVKKYVLSVPMKALDMANEAKTVEPPIAAFDDPTPFLNPVKRQPQT